MITDQYGNVTESAAATLTVLKDDVEITPPADQEAVIGESVVFSVVVDNAENVTYQWYFSNDGGTKWGKVNDDVDDGDPATLTLVAKAYRNNYQYKCVITDQYGNVTESAAATLTVTNTQ